MASDIRYAYQSGLTLYAAVRDLDGLVYYLTGAVFEAWGTGSRTALDYGFALTDMEGGLYVADMPTGMPRGVYDIQIYQQIGAAYADTDPCIGMASQVSYSTGLSGAASGTSGRLTCAEMIEEVQALTGTTTDDEPIATQARITRWINEAQQEVAHECPGLLTLQFKNTTSLDTTQSLRYAVEDITAGDVTGVPIKHLYYLSYQDGYESQQLTFLPTDEFDAKFPDPTHSDIPFEKPFYWTRRGAYIEIMPLSACSYCDVDIRIDGDLAPRDFTVNSTYYSDISLGVETGLIYYAVAQYYRAIADEARSEYWKRKFSNPTMDSDSEEGWLQRFKAQNDTMTEWDGMLFYPSSV